MYFHRQICQSAALFIALAAAPLTAQDMDAIYVTNPNDSGEGSLRAALILAAAERKQIVITTREDIYLESGLVYEAAFPLHITGSGQTIELRENENILSVINGLGLHLNNVHLKGRGGCSIERRADIDGPAGKGVFFTLSEGNVSHVNVSFINTSVRNVPGHGIHIADCGPSGDCADDIGSSGTIKVLLLNTTIEKVGYGTFDADGLRVDERGPGDIEFVGTNIDLMNVGADGIELDEGGDGRVNVDLSRATFRDNGNYCDPRILAPFLPTPLEAELEEGTMTADAIRARVAGAPDERCIESDFDLHDDGSVAAYEFEIDLDDGFDIDEAGEGDIRATISQIEMMNNTDEGLDFDEAGAGDLRLHLINSRFTQNTDDGVKLSEEDAGSLNADVARSFAFGNGGKGFVFEEADEGDLSATVVRVETNGNDDGDETGVEATQDDSGIGALFLIGSTLVDGIDTDGVTLIAE